MQRNINSAREWKKNWNFERLLQKCIWDWRWGWCEVLWPLDSEYKWKQPLQKVSKRWDDWKTSKHQHRLPNRNTPPKFQVQLFASFFVGGAKNERFYQLNDLCNDFWEHVWRLCRWKGITRESSWTREISAEIFDNFVIKKLFVSCFFDYLKGEMKTLSP